MGTDSRRGLMEPAMRETTWKVASMDRVASDGQTRALTRVNSKKTILKAMVSVSQHR